jgi:hypothetical protein
MNKEVILKVCEKQGFSKKQIKFAFDLCVLDCTDAVISNEMIIEGLTDLFTEEGVTEVDASDVSYNTIIIRMDE